MQLWLHDAKITRLKSNAIPIYKDHELAKLESEDTMQHM